MTEEKWIATVVFLAGAIGWLGKVLHKIYLDHKEKELRNERFIDSLRQEHRIEKDMLIEEHARTVKALEEVFNKTIDLTRLSNKETKPITEKEMRKTRDYLDDRMNKQKTPTRDQIGGLNGG